MVDLDPVGLAARFGGNRHAGGNAERRFSPQDILAAMEKQMRAEREKQFSRFS